MVIKVHSKRHHNQLKKTTDLPPTSEVRKLPKSVATKSYKTKTAETTTKLVKVNHAGIYKGWFCTVL